MFRKKFRLIASAKKKKKQKANCKNILKYCVLKVPIKQLNVFYQVQQPMMDHHHQEHGSGSAEKKVKIDKFLFARLFLPITIIPPAVFHNFLLEKSHILVARGDDYATNHSN